MKENEKNAAVGDAVESINAAAAAVEDVQTLKERVAELEAQLKEARESLNTYKNLYSYQTQDSERHKGKAECFRQTLEAIALMASAPGLYPQK